MRYALTDYKLAITLPDVLAGILGLSELTIGGEGSYLDVIEIEYDNDMWTTEGDATGSWVHNLNLSKVGKATVTLNQMSDKIARFKRICNLFYSLTSEGTSDYDGLTMVLTDMKNQVVATINDSFIQKIPRQAFGQTADKQAWVFTCGKITFN